MKRRAALAVLTAGIWAPFYALAEPSRRMPLVGMLITHPPVTDPVVDALRKGLQEQGYTDGQNIKLEVRSALGHLERVSGLAKELVKLAVDVIVVANEPALRAVTQATSTIPIVMAGYTDDPAAIGWIESYRRPGGNVTGAFTINAPLISKRLELMKETLPTVSRVAVFWDPAFGQRQIQELARLAPELGFRLQAIEVRSPDDLAPAFDLAKRNNAGAVLLVWSPLFYVHRVRTVALGIEAKLPILSDMSNMVEAGGLLSYGSLGLASFVRAGHYVARILQGAKAAELPVEQMTNIKLLVNLRTAKALGIKIPEPILLRADEVIQ